MSTLKVPSSISPRDDAIQLHRAFKGIGCDVGVVINILAHRDTSQRDDIQQEYETMFSNKDLKKQLSSELHGHLKKAVVLWMQNPLERDVTTLRQALTGPIIDLKATTEIICSRSPAQIRQIRGLYTRTYGAHVENEIESHASGDHKKLLLAYINTTRYEGPEIDQEAVDNDSMVVHKVWEKKSGVDEETLIQIFSERSKAHLVALESVYHKMHGKELRRAIKKGTSGNFKYCLMTILQCAESPAKHFATVLRKAMKGLGTADTTLIRIIVTRAELDMQEIKAEYRKKFGKTLTDVVHSETHGHYRTFLISLLGAD